MHKQRNHCTNGRALSIGFVLVNQVPVKGVRRGIDASLATIS
jgi:hypothetical protein